MYPVSMPTAVAIDYSEVTNFDVIPLLNTATKNSWIEKETSDFIDGEFILNPNAGEEEKSHSTMIALRRQILGKEQRIIITGDSDFISNSELATQRQGLQSNNYSAVKSIFRWLSNDKYPLNVSRRPLIDNEISLGKPARKPIKYLFTIVIPLMIVLLGLFTILRRQKK